MNKNEKELFFDLCNFTKDDKKIRVTSAKKYANATVLGNLFYNRMQGVAYGQLERNDLLSVVNREFRTSLNNAYEQNCAKNDSFFECIKWLSNVLEPYNKKYAMLKGALLCGIYPQGYRVSNDVDLLVAPNDVTEISDLLREAGFKQGNIRNGVFVPATRKEIIESKMTRGETVPFIKEVGMPYMKYLEVDINFSLDYKNSKTSLVNELISKSKVYSVGGLKIKSLSEEDFFIHLCGHLYKEATTFPWIEMNRDMTLYKYLDINFWLHSISDTRIKKVFERATELGMQEICACVVLWTEDLLPGFNDLAVKISKRILDGKEELLLKVLSPSDKVTCFFTEKSTVKRFFDQHRGKKIRRSY